MFSFFKVAALKWVRENIKAFSGDPGRITIMGQQAGGASVHYHMLSPLSRGLFARSDQYMHFLSLCLLGIGFLEGKLKSKALFEIEIAFSC